MNNRRVLHTLKCFIGRDVFALSLSSKPETQTQVPIEALLAERSRKEALKEPLKEPSSPKSSKPNLKLKSKLPKP